MKRRFNYNLIAGYILVGFIILVMIIDIFYTPYDPNKMSVAERFQPPNIKHFLGTDNFGRDIFSRIIDGTKTTLFVAVSTVFFGTFFGVIFGSISGYFGGFIDEIIMRINDALIAFPGILLALVIVTTLGQGKYQIVLALGIIFTPTFSRITRSEFLKIKQQDFIKSAEVFGASPFRIMFVHILPNTYPTLLSAITIGFSNAILSESALSFLGLGVKPPDPSWGRMLSEAQAYLFNAPWYAVASGTIIVITVLGFNFIGEGLRKIYG